MEPIAIIGIGCRFPGAENPQAFWQLLRDGVDAVTEAPAERRYSVADNMTEALVTEQGAKRWGGFLSQVDQFDPAFFKISPREAARIDPQQRLLLEVAWEALEDAGQDVERLAGTSTGVFMGVMNEEYAHVQLQKLNLVDAYLGVGSSSAVAANRVSYSFDLRGPSMVVNTLCSSSLVAVHLACQSLWSGESAPVALVGGVNIILRPAMDIFYAKSGLLAADGRCKTFDARADGLVRGEGAGVVLLKPLAQAQSDGDHIYALIRGSAVNQDGRSNGITAPSRWGQISVMTEAYRRAGISPCDIQYVEAHGTGTPLADSIEAMALGTVLGSERPPDSVCRVGSVKTNLGHLESASGIASLIKVALMLDQHELAPTIHFEKPHPYIPFSELQLRVQQTYEPWPAGVGPALAGINSFGLAGTNAHVVLEEAPAITDEVRCSVKIDAYDEAGEACLLPLSAHNEAALLSLAETYSQLLKADDAPSLKNISYTASTRRSHHDFRLSLLARSREECSESLQAFARGEMQPEVFNGRRIAGRRHKLVFVFADDEERWQVWLRELYQRETPFRASIEQCDALLREITGKSFLPAWLDARAGSNDALAEAERAGCFAFQVGLAALWRSWGVEPEIVVGTGVAGEVAAGYLAGILSLKDGLRVALCQTICQQEATGAAVGAGLVADNTAQHFAACCTDNQATALLTNINLHPASLPAISLRTGKEIVSFAAAPSDTTPQMIKTDINTTAIEPLISKGQLIFLQMGAQAAHANALAQCLRQYHREEAVLASLASDGPAREAMLKAASILYTQGRQLNWANISETKGQVVRLPLYAFQRERHWLDEQDETSSAAEPNACGSASSGKHPLLGWHSQAAHFNGSHLWEIELDQQEFERLHVPQHVDIDGLNAKRFADIALVAGAEAFDRQAWQVKEVEVKSALSVRAGETRLMQTTLVSGDGGAAVHLYSRRSRESQDSWTLHATVTLRAVAHQVETHGLEPTEQNTRETNCPTREDILDATSESERQRLLELFLLEQVASALDSAPSRLDVELPLSYLGLDSLLAVEIKQNVERKLGTALPLALLLQDANIIQLAGELAGRLAAAPQAHPVSSIPPEDEQAATLLANLDELSDGEVERLLGQMMAEEEAAE